MRQLLQICVAATVAGWLAGCGSAPGVLFDCTGAGRVWPSPPEAPRIRYVGELRGAADLKPGRGVGQAIGEAIFGRDPSPVMVRPIAVCADAEGRVFVADSGAGVVNVFDLETRAYAAWALPTDRGPSQPVAIACDRSGRVLVSDAMAGRVVAFDARGNRTSTIGEGILQRPCGVAVHPISGLIYIADVGAHQVVVFSDLGEERERIGSRGTSPGEFNYPTYLAFDESGRLYVSDSLNFRVQVLSPEGSPERIIGRKGDLPGYFSQPKGVAVDAHERVYVVDANFEAVQVFTRQGELLLSFGSEGKGPGEFWLPTGVCADAAGRIWVADSFNRRVQLFESLTDGESP